MKQKVAAWIIMVLGLAGLGAYIGLDSLNVRPPLRSQGEALIGGDFTLMDGAGNIVTNRDFAGKYMLIYFGFTHCPDICPTTLLVMRNALDRLGDGGRDVIPIFITVDPERDEVTTIGRYAKNFGDRLVGLTGTPEQIRAVADAYKIYYQKVEDKDSSMGYTVDHSSFIYLMGRDGKYLTHFPHTISEKNLAEGIRNHLE
ncbi:MAG: SCO family protein [Rickettsiales bacterium]|nr:SCO family protein [Rickettsiales bacterium]